MKKEEAFTWVQVTNQKTDSLDFVESITDSFTPQMNQNYLHFSRLSNRCAKTSIFKIKMEGGIKFFNGASMIGGGFRLVVSWWFSFYFDREKSKIRHTLRGGQTLRKKPDKLKRKDKKPFTPFAFSYSSSPSAVRKLPMCYAIFALEGAGGPDRPISVTTTRNSKFSRLWRKKSLRWAVGDEQREKKTNELLCFSTRQHVENT